MMIYWILITIAFIIWLWFLYKQYNLNKRLTTELINSKTPQIIIWKITEFKDKEFDLLLANPEIIDLLIKFYEYKIFTKTDSIRTLENTQEKVWYLNCLHEIHFIFSKLKFKLNKKEKEKIWQKLV